MGYRIKLLGVAQLSGRGLEQRMTPCLVPADSPLGQLPVSYTHLDVYKRQVNVSQKAAYTVSDMLSREMVTLPTTYVDGMQTLMGYLVGNTTGIRMRVTSVTYNSTKKQYQVEWSRSPNNAMPQLTTTTIANLASSIPTLADGDHVMLVETEVDYTPPFDIDMGDFSINIGNRVIKQFIVTRPRFVPKICLTGVTCT